ncbi:hypothetical protein BT96DRAFT_1017758 [Gymnopus androsaceus JB14]|uniref:MYND-type domain-containing protein n=1 Tax=Gymnopus androsaceus JB14 TaxID=1447944 RepID=A0A6A4HW90_9AGAR|nr:hypothetical protein BT96DRAFT_1017758 [Gymnopus androsaceus JB14]
MGQRHQAFIVARVVPHGSTDGKAYYRCLGAWHHQWCYGSLPLQVKSVQGKYGCHGETPDIPKVPCPYSVFLLASAFNFDLEENYTSGGLFEQGLLPAGMGCWDGDNNDGLTVLDITDPLNPSYAFVAGSKTDGDLGDEPCTAEDYLGLYYTGKMAAEAKCSLKRGLVNSEPRKALNTGVVQRANPYLNLSQSCPSTPSVDDVPSLTDLVVKPAVVRSLDLGNTDEVELMIPSKVVQIKTVLHARNPYPQNGLPLLVSVLQQEIKKEGDILDLAGFSLSPEQLVSVVSEFVDTRIVILSHSPEVKIDHLTALLIAKPEIDRLELLDIGITNDELSSLLDDRPEIFKCVSDLVHPHLVSIALAENPGAFTVVASQADSYIRYGDSDVGGTLTAVPVWTPAKIVQNLVDLLTVALSNDSKSGDPLQSIMVKATISTGLKKANVPWKDRSIPMVAKNPAKLYPDGWMFLFNQASSMAFMRGAPLGNKYAFMILLTTPDDGQEAQTYDIKDFLEEMKKEGRRPLPDSELAAEAKTEEGQESVPQAMRLFMHSIIGGLNPSGLSTVKGRWNILQVFLVLKEISHATLLSTMSTAPSSLPGIYAESVKLCRECKIHVPNIRDALQALRKHQVVDAGMDTQLSNVHYKPLFASWTDIRWWITALLNDFVVLKQPTTPEGFEFQKKILIIIPELSIYLDLQTSQSDEVSNKIKDLLNPGEFFEPMLELTVRTWIYVLRNCSRDMMSSHCAAIIRYLGRVLDGGRLSEWLAKFCAVLERIPGSEQAILRTVVQEVQGSLWLIEVLWVCTDVLFGCCLNEKMSGRLLNAGMVPCLCSVMKRMATRRFHGTKFVAHDRFAVSLSNCVQCILLAFRDSYSWIPLAIRCGFLQSMMHSAHFIIASRPNTDSIQDVETSMCSIFEVIQPFLLYRSVLRPVRRFIAQVPKRKPELYNEFINMPPNSQNPKTCIVTAWKEFVDVVEERQELREECADAGYIMCVNIDCPGDNRELRQCSNCRVTWYCSKDCQKSDWRRHRENCHYLRSRAICGGCPAPYSHIDEDFLEYVNIDRGRRFYTSPATQSALERNAGFLSEKVVMFDFRHHPHDMCLLSHSQYRANIKEGPGGLCSAKNYAKIKQSTVSDDIIFSIQGIFPGEQGFPRCIVTGFTWNDLANSEDGSPREDGGSDGEAHGENSDLDVDSSYYNNLDLD